MFRKLFKKNICPKCDAQLKYDQPKSMWVVILVEELSFFGGLGLLIFGRGKYDIIGGLLVVLSIILILLFTLIIKINYICPKCGYKTINTGS